SADPPDVFQLPNLPAGVTSAISFDTFVQQGPFPPYMGLIGLYDGIDNQPGLVVGMDPFFANSFAGRTFSDAFGFDEAQMVDAVRNLNVPVISDWANFNAAVFIQPADVGGHNVVIARGELPKFSTGTPAGSIFVMATPLADAVPEPAMPFLIGGGLLLLAAIA